MNAGSSSSSSTVTTVMASDLSPPFTGEESVSQADKEAIRSILNKKVSGDYVAQRPGPGGSKLFYLQSWRSNQLANRIFGYENWTSSVQSLTLDYVEQNGPRWTVCATAVIRVTIRDGGFHEDVGCGIANNMPDQGSAIEKAKKEALSDGRKRALRVFGDALGNCLYDKRHLGHLGSNVNFVNPETLTEADFSRKRSLDQLSSSTASTASTSSHFAPPFSTSSSAVSPGSPSLQQRQSPLSLSPSASATGSPSAALKGSLSPHHALSPISSARALSIKQEPTSPEKRLKPASYLPSAASASLPSLPLSSLPLYSIPNSIPNSNPNPIPSPFAPLSTAFPLPSLLPKPTARPDVAAPPFGSTADVGVFKSVRPGGEEPVTSVTAPLPTSSFNPARHSLLGATPSASAEQATQSKIDDSFIFEFEDQDAEARFYAEVAVSL